VSRFLVPFVFLCLSGGSAWATPSDDAGQRAELHSKRGVTFYQQGKLADAVREMLEAYKAVPDPALLFNIARIYEKLGETQIAIGYYQKFVTSEGAEPARVQKAIEYMQALREKGKAAAVPAPAAPPPVTPPPPPVMKPAPAEVSSTPAMVGVAKGVHPSASAPWLGPVIVGTLGVGALSGGLVFAARSKQAEKDIESYDLSYQERLQAQSDGRADTLTADVLMIAGGVGILGAFLWYSLAESDEVPPAPAKSGLVAGVTQRGVFVGVSGVLP